jgi:hypothetical protein
MEELTKLSLLVLAVGVSIFATALWLFFRDVKSEGRKNGTS